MASHSRERARVATKLLWLLENLLEAVTQPLTLAGLIVLTALLLLRLALASGG